MSRSRGSSARVAHAAGRGHPLAPAGERVLLDGRPSFAYVLVRGIPEVLPAVVLGVTVWLLRGLFVSTASSLDRALGARIDVWLGYLIVGAGVYATVRIVWAMLDWFCRRYVLTEARIIAQHGVISTVRFDLPLRRIQHLAVTRSFLERVFGVGSVLAASAGTDGHEIVWRTVRHPKRSSAAIRERVDKVARHGDEPDVIPVIGLVGGVGSGKSSAANAFERLGCLVSDSDQAVRAVLARDSVRDELVSWWGRGVLDADGSVDRKKVADIVFRDDYERRRLEGLVHPLVRASREELIERALGEGASGVIVDAPLLFEAGVDAECDAVVFVETPRDVRLERVKGRGWDDGELDRRENAQMPLEEKRRRSDYVLVNHGTLDELESRAAKLLAAIRKQLHPRGPDRARSSR